MKSSFKSGIFCAALFLFFIQTQAFSGDIPRPFENPNRRVELATGENYILVGKILTGSDGVSWFFVDFKTHPWLASKERLATPFYRLESKLSINLDRYSEKRVQVAVKVGGKVMRDAAKGYVYQLVLELLASPKLNKVN